MSRLGIWVRTILLVAFRVIGAVAASMLPAALAQETEAGDPPTPPMYRVEVVILRHIDQSRTTEETRVQRDPALPPGFNINGLDEVPDTASQRDTVGSRSGRLAPPATDRPASSVKFLLLDPVPTPPDFVQLVPAQFKLAAVWDKLNELEAYRPLLHIAWLQSARSEGEAVPYDLVITDADPDVVTGTLTLYKQRFLHFKVDLTMREADDMEANSARGFWSRFTFAPDNEDVVHQMHQSRRIRSDNLQYFDHPRFGVIAAITELVVEEEDAPETAASTL